MNVQVDRQRIDDILSELVAIPSVNPGFPGGMGEAALAAYVAGFFERLGLSWLKQDVEPGRENVIGILPGLAAGAGALLLEAHMDTVQTEGMTIEPYGAVIREGKLYGRGACDTKASLAAMLAAVEALALRGVKPPLDVHVAAVVDEEIRYRGVAKLAEEIEAGRQRYAGAIVGEPTGLELIIAHKGCVRFAIEAVGVACHSSTPHLGANAIEAMMDVVAFLRREAAAALSEIEHPLVGRPTLCVSMIEGGIAPNTVPERCRITIDRRTVPGEEPMQVWRELKERIEALTSSVPGAAVIVHEPFLIDYAMDAASDEPVVRCLAQSVRGKTGGAAIIGATYGSDASKLARVGVPSVVFGPGSLEQAHTKDEWVELDEVARAADILIQTILSFKVDP
ncbi:MAG: acetylornithine deacetylase [Paenibacillus sp.]|nr:acetylornithine deacetylase [Paenibacillus sp.]